MRLKILLLGNTGQLGWELNRTLLTLGELIALDYPQIDMANLDNIRSVVRDTKPNLIVNATAYTNVDQAEIEPDVAYAINGVGPGTLAKEAKKRDSFLIHYSTDYVFDGAKGDLYHEEDHPNPINKYGDTKFAGELAVQKVGGAFLIFRTSWVYSLRRPCFVTKVLQWAHNKETLRIVDDQISTPTWSRTLAEATGQIIAQGKDDPLNYLREKSGLYHLSNSGFCSRYEWAKFIIGHAPQKENFRVKEILKAKSDEFPSPAKRPRKSAMSCMKFEQSFGIKMPLWELGLKLAF
jgi:dTDP-4-dehydrorhamnose reductase